jgi:DNA-binding NtrC family response regulator
MTAAVSAVVSGDGATWLVAGRRYQVYRTCGQLQAIRAERSEISREPMAEQTAGSRRREQEGRKAREEFERQYLAFHLARFGGNISRTAGFVGMDRAALHRKLKGLGVHNSDKPAKVDA